jgi:hypothetical protein
MQVKKALVAVGVSLILAMILSAPTFAQTAAQPVLDTAIPGIEPAPDAPLDALIDQATTPAERTKLLLRCSGPPPIRPKAIADASKAKPASEPAVVVHNPHG